LPSPDLNQSRDALPAEWYNAILYLYRTNTRELKMKNGRFWTAVGIILTAALCRVFPHPPNVTPIMAMALFGGTYISNKRLAFLIPLAAMLLSDVFLGFHKLMIFVYLAFTITVLLGIWIRKNENLSRILLGTLCGSLFFFALTNFGVWAFGALYPPTLTGLTECFIAAIPFFRASLFGNLFYAAVFFGGFALCKSRFPTLEPALE